MRIEAVSFDGDGTLWDFDAAMRGALQMVLTEIRRRWPGPATDDLDVEDLIATRDAVAAAHRHDWSRLEDIRREAFATTLGALDGADVGAADDLNELYLHHRFADIELFDDVTDCLTELAGSHLLGLVSNGNSYPERCGLEGRFAFTVFAQDHGVAKPDPRLFEVAAAEAGCPLSTIVHVGDGEADVLGATRAGCHAVLLDRGGRRPWHAEHADDVIADLRELPHLLASLGAR